MKIETKFKFGQTAWGAKKQNLFFHIRLVDEKNLKRSYEELMSEFVEKVKIESITVTAKKLLYNFFPNLFFQSFEYKESELYLTKEACIKANYAKFKKQIDGLRRQSDNQKKSKIKQHMAEHTQILKLMAKEGK